MDSRKAALCCMALWLGSEYIYADPQDAGDKAPAGNEVAVTFFTEPANASLYSPSGGLYGATPLTLYYEVPATWNGCVELEALQAVWVSGAESEAQLTACPENSRSQHYTFTRPDVAGTDLDIWFAEKVQQLAMVEDPLDDSRNPARAASAAKPVGNLVSCADNHSGQGC